MPNLCLGLKIKIMNRKIYSTRFINDWHITHIFNHISVLSYCSFLMLESKTVKRSNVIPHLFFLISNLSPVHGSSPVVKQRHYVYLRCDTLFYLRESMYFLYQTQFDSQIDNIYLC